MAVVPIQSMPRCKLCQSPHRPVMDALLEMRSTAQEDKDGKRVNFEYVAERYASLHPGQKLTKENCTLHFKNHCEVRPDEETVDTGGVLAETHAARLEIFERVLGPDWRSVSPTADQILELQRALYVLELERRAASGENLGLTHDHALKGIDSSTKRKTSEAQSALLQGIGAGIARWAVEGAPERKELPEGDGVIEGEIIEEAELA